ncbi:restriction endonuclease subunit S [Eubacterium sp.]
MNLEIRQRIEQIKNGEVPEGYRYSRAGLSPNDWGEGSLSDVLYNEQRAIPKPNEGYWRIGIRSHAKGTFHEYIENPEMINMDELYVVKENDLILNITFAWEHAVALADKNDDGLLVSHRFPTYVFCEGQNPFFYKNVIVQERFKEMLVQISPGGAGRNRVMSKKDFLKLPCNIPSCEEQQKIAEILMQCDKLIELYQNEIDELQKLKKICFCKMFPKSGNDVPEWRFPQFTDAWEQRKVQDVADRFDNLRIPVAANLRVHGTTPYYGANGIQDYVEGFTHDGEFVLVAEDGANDLKNYPVKCVNGRIWVNNHAHVLQGKAGIANNSFLAFAISQSDIESLLVGGGRAKLNAETLMSIEFRLPCLQEQYRIGKYLTQLDHLITLHQRKLAEMEKQKKSLTQLLLTGIVRV